MNLEQYQSMSDDELNELAAVKVMGWRVEKYPAWTLYIDSKGMQHEAMHWNPTNDMNDAMELYNALNNREKNSFVKHMLIFFENVSKRGLETWDIVEMLKLPIKYWVIASILSKE